MAQIRLLKEPGYIYDLFFIFYLKFNTKRCFEAFNINEKQSDTIQYLNDIQDQFSDIPENLFVFFHAIENGRCFMTTQYFNPYKEQFTTTFNFKFLQNELLDSDRLIRKLIRFYFYELSDEAVEECMNSKTAIFLQIKDSKYSFEEKSRLYEFFVTPEPYLQALRFELMAKDFMLSQYYEKNYQRILKIYNETTFEILSENLKGIDNLEFIKRDNQELYVSFCILNTIVINFIGMQEGVIYILGLEYISVIDLINNKKDLSILDLGNAICEESRVKILDLLLNREEVTCKDLEKIFSFSGSTAYHHITMMLKFGLVKTRNEGKTILYSLNRKYFDAIIDVLSKYSSKKRGDTT